MTEKTRFVRQFDEIGRIVLPMELRQTMKWNEKTLLEISVDEIENRVIIQERTD